MGLYNDTVMDHFMNPVCGDMMQIQIQVENDVITDAKFKTFGCGSAIASSSMATSMIIGKTVDEALEISNKQIIEELGGLPAVKVHCSVLADHAIKSAIYDYAEKNGKTYKGLEGFDPNADEDDHDHIIEE